MPFKQCHFLKIMDFAFVKGYGVPWMTLSISLSLFVSLFLAFVRCFAMAIDMWRLVVCWNHIDGVVVWWVSPYMSLHSSPHMVLTPSRRWCSEFVANVHALKKANSFVLDRAAGLFPSMVAWLVGIAWLAFQGICWWCTRVFLNSQLGLG